MMGRQGEVKEVMGGGGGRDGGIEGNSRGQRG